MKRFLSFVSVLVLLACACISFPAVSKADESVRTVRSYSELLSALEDKTTTRVLISPRYRHGKVRGEVPEVINLEGKNVTIASATEETAIIDGHVIIQGPGSVVFDNVNIHTKDSDYGLCADTAEITIESVRAGDSKKTQGGTAVILLDSILHIGSATGGNSVNGMAGDGIHVAINSTVYAREVTGGSCENGVGGAGIIAESGVSVTVTGKVSGGDGAVSPGKAFMGPKDVQIDGSAVQEDGKLLDSKKAPDPEKINSYALLLNAIRNGRTEIRLDASYKDGRVVDSPDCEFYNLTGETVSILGAYDNRLQKIDRGFRVNYGDWRLSGLDIVSKDGPGLVACGQHIFFEGNMTTSVNENSTITIKAGSVEVVGNVSHKGRKGNAVCISKEDCEIRVKGEVTGNDYPAIFLYHGKATVEGSVVFRNRKQYAIYVMEGEVDVIGTVKAVYPYGVNDPEKARVTITNP